MMTVETTNTLRNLFATILSDMWDYGTRPHIQIDMTQPAHMATAEPAVNLNAMSKDGIFTLNLSPDAIGQVHYFEEYLTVQTRFNGRVHTVCIPYKAISLIYDQFDSRLGFASTNGEIILYSETLDEEKFSKSIAAVEAWMSEKYEKYHQPGQVEENQTTISVPLLKGILNGKFLQAFMEVMTKLNRSFMIQEYDDGAEIMVSCIRPGTIAIIEPDVVRLKDADTEFEELEIHLNVDKDGKLTTLKGIFTSPDSTGKCSVYMNGDQVCIDDHDIWMGFSTIINESLVKEVPSDPGIPETFKEPGILIQGSFGENKVIQQEVSDEDQAEVILKQGNVISMSNFINRTKQTEKA